MNTARTLSDHLASLLATEHGALADFLVALADFDRRRLWVELGHASLFYFLHRELGLSKGAAYHRKVAAELLQRFPEVEEPMRDGRLCITSVVELARVMTAENRAEVLPRFFHRSKKEARAVAAEIRPAEVVTKREVVTRVATEPETPSPVGLPHPRVAASGPPAAPLVHPDEPARRPGPMTHAEDSSAREAPCRRPPPSPATDTAEPLTADLRRLHITVSRRFLGKLEAARLGLSHAIPGATSEQVLEAALDLLLERQASRKGLVARPRAPKPAEPDAARGASAEASVPAHVRRAVWTRDAGRCQWPLDGGGVCGSTVRVELDHVVPRARGGPPTVANLRLLCKFHNQLAARQAFGEEWMSRFVSAP